MSQTYTELNYHIIFGTKERRPFLAPEYRDELCKYVGGIVKSHAGHPIAINAFADHAHLLVRLPPSIAVSDLVRGVKASSSKWLNDTKMRNRSFGWQDGYSAFTVSQSQTERVAEYIRHQEKHHRTKSFREELVLLLKGHEVSYDERYLPG
jgi:putative transposase